MRFFYDFVYVIPELCDYLIKKSTYVDKVLNT